MKLLDMFLNSTPGESVLCIIVETLGSAPRHTGSKMLVTASGECSGSVGGGGMEHRVIKAAENMLVRREQKPRILSFMHTEAAQPGQESGMICSGSQKVVLVPLTEARKKTGKAFGLSVNEKGLVLLCEPPETTGFCTTGNTWEYTEEIIPPPMTYIFGGGHCSLALTHVLKLLELPVTVVDDRNGLPTMENNSDAFAKVVRSYESVSDLVPDDGKAMVVVMTASHGADSTVLRQMLGKKLRYLGLMASKTTGKHVLGKMRSHGFTEEELASVHTPIGVPIHSHTPEEIAISIAAEIVAVLNGPRR